MLILPKVVPCALQIGKLNLEVELAHQTLLEMFVESTEVYRLVVVVVCRSPAKLYKHAKDEKVYSGLHSKLRVLDLYGDFLA